MVKLVSGLISRTGNNIFYGKTILAKGRGFYGLIFYFEYVQKYNIYFFSRGYMGYWLFLLIT